MRTSPNELYLLYLCLSKVSYTDVGTDTHLSIPRISFLGVGNSANASFTQRSEPLYPAPGNRIKLSAPITNLDSASYPGDDPIPFQIQIPPHRRSHTGIRARYPRNLNSAVVGSFTLRPSAFPRRLARWQDRFTISRTSSRL
jgi:hypothetical protein